MTKKEMKTNSQIRLPEIRENTLATYGWANIIEQQKSVILFNLKISQ